MNRLDFLRKTSTLLLALCIAYPASTAVASGEFLHRSPTSTPIKCRYEQQRERNVYNHRYERECEREYESCHRNSEEKGVHAQSSSQCTEHVYQNALKLEGSCPKFLAQVEATSDESIEQTLAKVALRGRFHEIRSGNGIRYVPFRKEDSIAKLKKLLSEQPSNLYALHLLVNNFTDIAEEYEELSLRTDLLQQDHVCDTALNFGVEIVIRQYLHFLSSYAGGINPESKLQPDEMATITKKVWDGITSTYLDLWDYGPPYQDITLAYRISNPLVMIEDDDEGKVFYELLGERRLSAYERTLERIENEVLDLYSLDSDKERATQLETICSDVAFEMGLFDECTRSIKHYSTEDASAGLPFKKDLYKASIRTLLTVTRSCSGLSTYALRHGMRTIGFSGCFYPLEKPVTNEIKAVLRNYGEENGTWFENILWSYAYLDFHTVDHFAQALATNLNSLSHVLLLANRLVERGNRDAAIAIVNESMKAVNNIPPEERSRYKYKILSVMGHLTAVSQFQYSIQQESDLVSLLSLVLDQVRTGNPIEFHESQFQFGG